MTEPLDLIPAPVQEAFEGHSELSLRELAKAMGRDIRTLRRHREAEDAAKATARILRDRETP